jgi:nitrate/nitrite-specific signal transduction histidine kinase
MTLATFTGQSTMSFTQYVAHLEITPGRAYAPFWSAFIQVLRSTMEARQARGQSTQSTIRVTTGVTSDRFTLTVEDDGPGADWAAVRTACEALGGSVEIEPRNGEGARISFAFPNQGTVSERNTAVPQQSDTHETSAA